MRNSKGILNFIKLIPPARNFSAYKLLFLSLVVLLASCDPLFIGPMGRYNRQDDKGSLIRFDAFPYGDGQIFVGWNWLDQERAVRNDIPLLEPQWDKIIIKEREDALPLSRLGGTEISITDDTWYKVFSDLEYDSEYYFALWPHEKGGEWLAPVYMKQHVEMPEPVSETGMALFDIYQYVKGGTYASAPATFTVDENNWFFIYTNMDSNVVVKSALLTLDISSFAGELLVSSLRWDDGDGDMTTLFDFADNPDFERQNATETFLNKSINSIAVDDTYDISNVLSRAVYHGPSVIVLRGTVGSTITIDTTTFTPSISYEGVWRW